MDEQLIKLLDAARANGANANQMQIIVDSYNQKKKSIGAPVLNNGGEAIDSPSPLPSTSQSPSSENSPLAIKPYNVATVGGIIQPEGTFYNKPEPIKGLITQLKEKAMGWSRPRADSNAAANKNEPNVQEAIAFTVNNNLQRRRGVYDKKLPTPTKDEIDFEKKVVTDAYNRGDIVPVKDANGASTMRRGTGFFESLKNAVNDTFIRQTEIEYVKELNDSETIRYLNNKMTSPDSWGYSQEKPSGFAGGAGQMLGGTANLLMKGAVAATALTVAAPAAIGSGSFGSFLGMANDLANTGYLDALEKNYYQLKQQGVPDEEAYAKAKQLGLVGAATELAVGAVQGSAATAPLRASRPAVKGVVDGLLRSGGQLIKEELPKVAASETVGRGLQAIIEKTAGVDVKAEDVVKNIGSNILGELALPIGMWALTQPTQFPSYLRPQFENIVATADRNTVEQVYKAAEQQGIIPEGAADKTMGRVRAFDETKKSVVELPIAEEKKAAISGKLLQKQKLVNEQENLSQNEGAFKERLGEIKEELAAIDEQISEIYKADSPFDVEEDKLTGEKPVVLMPDEINKPEVTTIAPNENIPPEQKANVAIILPESNREPTIIPLDVSNNDENINTSVANVEPVNISNETIPTQEVSKITPKIEQEQAAGIVAENKIEDIANKEPSIDASTTDTVNADTAASEVAQKEQGSSEIDLNDKEVVADVFKTQWDAVNRGELIANDGEPIQGPNSGILNNGLETLTNKKWGHGSDRADEKKSLEVLDGLLGGAEFKGDFGLVNNIEGGYGVVQSGKFIVATDSVDSVHGENGNKKLSPTEVEIILNDQLSPFGQALKDKHPGFTIKDYNGNEVNAKKPIKSDSPKTISTTTSKPTTRVSRGLRAAAKKIREGEVPTFFKANLPKDTSVQGFGGKDLAEAVAKGLETVADLIDSGAELAKAVEQGFAHIKSHYSDNKAKMKDEAGMKEQFANYVNEQISNEDKGEVPNENELRGLATSIPKSENLREYGSKGTIQKYHKEDPRNSQEIFEQELRPALIHGETFVSKAKEVFGDSYAEKTLDFIDNEKLKADEKALIYITLENDMMRRVLADPNNTGLKKLQDLVRAKSQAHLRTGALAINYGKLRKIGEVGYDISQVTDNFFSPTEREQKAEVEQSVQADADAINKEAAQIEQEKSDTPIEDVQKLIDEGVEAEVAKLYEKLPTERRKKADKVISALDNLQKKLRSKTYADPTGVVALTDLGITAIKSAIKAGVNIADAVEYGIGKIKEKLGKEWPKENEFRQDVLEGLKAEGVNAISAAKQTAKEYRILETERNRQLKKVGELKDKLALLEKGQRAEPKKSSTTVDVPEIEQLKKQIKDAESALSKIEAQQKRINDKEIELQRLKDRKPKDKKELISKEISDRERELNEQISAEKEIIRRELKDTAPEKTNEERLGDAKESLQGRIDAVREEIINKERAAKASKKKLNKDLEYVRLEEQYKSLTDLRDKYLPKEEATYVDEKAIKTLEKKLSNDIAKINEQIRKGEKNDKAESKELSSDKITSLRAEKEARIAMLDALDPNPKIFTENALIQAGFGREIKVKTKSGTETRQVVDWKKLAGEEGSVDKIRANVEAALVDSGYSAEEVSRMKDAFEEQYNNIRASVIEKSLTELVNKNKKPVTAEQKSAARKLSELYNYGLFEQNPVDYGVLLGKAIGMENLSHERFNKARQLGQALQHIYSTEFLGRKLNDLELKSAIQRIETMMRWVLHDEAHSHGSSALAIADLARTWMDATQRMALNSVKQAVENPLSGLEQTLISNLDDFINPNAGTSKELRKQKRKLAEAIYKDMVLKGGSEFGDVNTQFVSKGNLEMYISRYVAKMNDNELFQAIISTAIGKSTLDAVDGFFKSKLTEQKFVNNLIKILREDRVVNGKIQKGMDKDDAVRYVSEKLTGQSLEAAKVTAQEIFDKVNSGAEKIFVDSKYFVDRLANDIVKAALVSGNIINSDMVTAAYNSAYKAAGRSLGHVANNPVSESVQSVSAKLEKKINDEIKNKNYKAAARLTWQSILFRNVLNPFVGGGTNWVVLKLEKNGLGLVNGLYNGTGKKLDLTSDAGISELENSLYEQARFRDSFMRGAVGSVTSAMIAALWYGVVGTDDYEKWRKNNKWSQKYLDLFTPEHILIAMASHDDKIPEYFRKTFNKNDQFDKDKPFWDALKYFSQNKKEKMYGQLGKGFGQAFGVPIPWRLKRDMKDIWLGASGQEPYSVDYSTPKTFISGALQGGFLEYAGLRPTGAGDTEFLGAGAGGSYSNDQLKANPALKYFNDNDIPIKKSDPDQIEIKDKKTKTKVKLASYGEDKAKEYNAVREKDIFNQLRRLNTQGVYVDDYGNVSVRFSRTGTFYEPNGRKAKKLSDLSVDQLKKLKSTISGNATEQATKQFELKYPNYIPPQKK